MILLFFIEINITSREISFGLSEEHNEMDYSSDLEHKASQSDKKNFDGKY